MSILLVGTLSARLAPLGWLDSLSWITAILAIALLIAAGLLAEKRRLGCGGMAPIGGEQEVVRRHRPL